MRIPSFVASGLRGDRVAGRLLRPVANHLLPSRTIPVTVLSGPAKGLKLVINPQNEKSFWTGSQEPEVLSALGRLLRPGAVYWDVGAHIGLHTLFASRCVGPNGHVHAFEPAPATATRLRRAVDLNHAANVTVHEMALTNKVGSSVLYHSELSSMRTLIPGLQHAHSQGDTVRCETADRMAEQLGMPDLIKIDVECAENMVFEGARQLISQAHPVLIVEFWTPEAAAQARAVFPEYRFARLDPADWLMTPETAA